MAPCHSLCALGLWLPLVPRPTGRARLAPACRPSPSRPRDSPGLALRRALRAAGPLGGGGVWIGSPASTRATPATDLPAPLLPKSGVLGKRGAGTGPAARHQRRGRGQGSELGRRTSAPASRISLLAPPSRASACRRGCPCRVPASPRGAPGRGGWRGRRNDPASLRLLPALPPQPLPSSPRGPPGTPTRISRWRAGGALGALGSGGCRV